MTVVPPQTTEHPDALLWRDLATLALTVGRALDQRLQRDAEISLPDYEVLGALARGPEDRMRPRDLGLGLRWEKSRLSHQLRRMETRGLVDRTVCAADLRGAVVGATPAGRSAYERARPGFLEELAARLGRPLDEADRTVLVALTQRVLGTATEAGLCAGDDADG